jgi:pimeloyl-ACP methyl ester carboxylesterase
VRRQIAGVTVLVAGEADGERPVIVFVNAATPRGIDEPVVGRFLGALAHAGFTAVAPELPRVRECEVTPRTVDALVSVTAPFGRGVALIGASTGAGLAILAAGDPRLAHRVSAVTAVAPFASLREILRIGTTATYRGLPFQAAPLVGAGAARSLIASAPDDPGVRALLANRDPLRFDELFTALAPSTRTLVGQLSPLRSIGDVAAPVEIVAGVDDPFFPMEEAHALAQAGRGVRLTVTSALDHVTPRLHPDAVRLARVLGRTLARAAESSRQPQPRRAPRGTPRVA